MRCLLLLLLFVLRNVLIKIAKALWVTWHSQTDKHVVDTIYAATVDNISESNIMKWFCRTTVQCTVYNSTVVKWLSSIQPLWHCWFTVLPVVHCACCHWIYSCRHMRDAVLCCGNAGLWHWPGRSSDSENTLL